MNELLSLRYERASSPLQLLLLSEGFHRSKKKEKEFQEGREYKFIIIVK